MAKNKKSFILYVDQKGTIEKLTDEQAGKLIKHIFRYVNDEDPEAPDFITELAFEPIKTHLKRDLEKWRGTKNERSESGLKGNLKRWHPELYQKYKNGSLTLAKALELSHSDKEQSQKVAKIAVNDNVNVNVNDNVIPKGIGKELRNSLNQYFGMRADLQKGIPLTSGQCISLIRGLKQLSKNEKDQIKIVERSFRNGWKDFYPLDEKKSLEVETSDIPESKNYHKFG